MSITIKDRLHVSPAGFFHVWKLTNGFGVYNQSGTKVATVSRLELAKLAADAFETRYQD